MDQPILPTQSNINPTSVVPEPPRKKSYTWLLTLILLLLVGVAGFFAWESYRLKSQLAQVAQPSPLAQLSPTASVLPTPIAEPSADTSVYAGWQTYTNTQYGFELRYPSNFKALTDQENLYGWPKAVVLFYSGGQAYDMAVEVWNSEAEYKQKYPTTSLTVYKKGDKFITLTNADSNQYVGQIIASFKFTD